MPYRAKTISVLMLAVGALIGREACAAAITALAGDSAEATSAPSDRGTPGQMAPAVVPFELYSGHIYIKVLINGKGPFNLGFDSGALNVLTPATAMQLGLVTAGKIEAHGTGGVQSATATRVDRVDVGTATLRDQTFYVVQFPPPAAEGRVLDGLIGFEWLSQFPTRIDYAKSTLTFFPRQGFVYSGPAKATPLQFRGRLPQIDGAVDGISGRFSIDTGSNGSLTLYPAFVDKNALVSRLNAKTETMSAVGIGGPVYALMTRVGELNLAGHVVAKPVTFLSKARLGASSDAKTAGNIGSGILRRFAITFDYPKAQAFFEPNATFGEPDLADRSGLRVNAADNGFKIVFVVNGSTAMLAGLSPDDVIVAVNAQPATGLDLATFRSQLKGPVGTKFSLVLESGKLATLVLKDID